MDYFLDSRKKSNFFKIIDLFVTNNISLLKKVIFLKSINSAKLYEFIINSLENKNFLDLIGGSPDFFVIIKDLLRKSVVKFSNGSPDKSVLKSTLIQFINMKNKIEDLFIGERILKVRKFL